MRNEFRIRLRKTVSVIGVANELPRFVTDLINRWYMTGRHTHVATRSSADLENLSKPELRGLLLSTHEAPSFRNVADLIKEDSKFEVQIGSGINTRGRIQLHKERVTVRSLQRALNELSTESNLTPDGRFGRNTATELELFQGNNGLEVTGKLDANTAEALADALDAKRQAGRDRPREAPTPVEPVRPEADSTVQSEVVTRIPPRVPQVTSDVDAEQQARVKLQSDIKRYVEEARAGSPDASDTYGVLKKVFTDPSLAPVTCQALSQIFPDQFASLKPDQTAQALDSIRASEGGDAKVAAVFLAILNATSPRVQ